MFWRRGQLRSNILPLRHFATANQDSGAFTELQINEAPDSVEYSPREIPTVTKPTGKRHNLEEEEG
jgi:hypothetical protein